MIKKPSQQLIIDCINQKRLAQHTLYKSCYGFMMSISYRYTSNKDDCVAFVNDAFLKILKGLPKYQQDIPFEMWVRRITINAIIDEYRKQKRNRENMVYTDQLLDFDIQTKTYDDANQQLSEAQLLKMINNLPNITKQVFNLYAIDGYSHKEISDMLEMAEGTSKWHLSNARKLLKDMIVKTLSTLKTITIL